MSIRTFTLRLTVCWKFWIFKFSHKYADTWPDMFVLKRPYILIVFHRFNLAILIWFLLILTYNIAQIYLALTNFLSIINMHSFTKNTFHVDFYVFYPLKDEGMWTMFKNLEASGLQNFLGYEDHIYEMHLPSSSPQHWFNITLLCASLEGRTFHSK